MLDIKTVYECNRCLGCKTLHPQVSLINLESPNLEQEAVKFEFYAILLIEDCPDGCHCCGRKYYDYSNATMVFLTPGEIFRMSENNTLPDKGYLLAFHPDLLFRTSLDNPIKNYTFFAYRKEEALHLSQRETAKIRERPATHRRILYGRTEPFRRLLQRPVKIRDRQDIGGIFSVQTVECG